MASSSNTPAAVSNDDGGMDAFSNIAHEAMKIERVVCQQAEQLTAMKKLLNKCLEKEERENTKMNNLKKEIETMHVKNRLLKENLQSKINTRHMVEQMKVDLEHQLYLEQNSIKNKIQSFEQTQQKYDELWKQYESVYMSSDMAKKLKSAEEEKENLIKTVRKLETDKEALKSEYLQKMKTMTEQRNTLVVNIVKGIKHFQNLEDSIKNKMESLQCLIDKEKQASEELEKLRDVAEQKKATKANDEATGKINAQKENLKSTWYKNMLNFGDLSVPKLVLPDLSQEQEIECNDEDVTYSFSEYVTAEDSDVMMTYPQADLQENHNAAGTEDETVVQQQAMEVDSATQEHTPQDIEMNSERSADQPSQMSVQQTTQEQSVTTQEMSSQQDSRGELQRGQQTEQAPQDDLIGGRKRTLSQEPQTESALHESGTEPADIQVEPAAEEHQSGNDLQQISDGESTACEEAQPAMSQASQASSLELLDDERRKAYLSKLMASPEFAMASMPRNSTSFNEPQQNCQQGNQNYLNNMHQMFHAAANNETNEPMVPVTNNEEIQRQEYFMQNNQGSGFMDMFGNSSVPQEPNNQMSMFGGMSNGDQGMASPFMNMFGNPNAGQQSSENPGFNFFGSPANSETSNIFGGNIFGGAENPANGFAGNANNQRSPEAFNLNFNDKDQTSSVFKLF